MVCSFRNNTARRRFRETDGFIGPTRGVELLKLPQQRTLAKKKKQCTILLKYVQFVMLTNFMHLLMSPLLVCSSEFTAFFKYRNVKWKEIKTKIVTQKVDIFEKQLT
jgi:hypothetical protein